MNSEIQNSDGGFERLESMIYTAVDRITELKKANKEFKSEINELKRLLALSEKKAERIKKELDEFTSNGKRSWKNREKDIKKRLLHLSAKISAFEKNYSMES